MTYNPHTTRHPNCNICGTPRLPSGKCSACHERYRKSTRCPMCGEPKCNASRMCKPCLLKTQQQNAKPKVISNCPDCGGPKSHPKNKRCIACEKIRRKTHGHFKAAVKRTDEMKEAQRKKYWEMRRQAAPDKTVIAAAKPVRHSKYCRKCGVKITTRECVACAVLSRIGEKGFR